MADPQTLRQLKIKTGVVRRLHKEEGTYREEVITARANADKLIADNADGADVRNAERVVADSQQMIPRTRKQLEDGVLALQDLVDGLKDEAEVAASQEYKDATEILQQVETAWQAEKK